jgi:hypothetical protein
MPDVSGNIVDGKPVRNCQLSIGTPSMATSTRRTTSTTSPITVAANTSAVKTRSNPCRLDVDASKVGPRSGPFFSRVCAISRPPCSA